MTKGEIHKIDKRVDEINSIIELCSNPNDYDVLETLQKELDSYIELLERDLKNEKRRVFSIVK